MYDKELAREILSQIYQTAQTILQRFEPVRSVNDFIELTNIKWCRRRDSNPHTRKALPPQDSVSTKFHHFGTGISHIKTFLRPRRSEPELHLFQPQEALWE